MTTPFHSHYWAHQLTLRSASDSMANLSRSFSGAKVDLNPHQVDAALFAFPNLTLKKIPHSVLAKCEWGKDDYSLNIKNLPSAPALDPEPVSIEPGAVAVPRRRGRPSKTALPSMGTPSLGMDEAPEGGEDGV